LLASVDLQAKAYIANMTMHIGDYGCLTCEEKGLNVKHGKGDQEEKSLQRGPPVT
jgi:hypothetical protein